MHLDWKWRSETAFIHDDTGNPNEATELGCLRRSARSPDSRSAHRSQLCAHRLATRYQKWSQETIPLPVTCKRNETLRNRPHKGRPRLLRWQREAKTSTLWTRNIAERSHRRPRSSGKRSMFMDWKTSTSSGSWFSLNWFIESMKSYKDPSRIFFFW